MNTNTKTSFPLQDLLQAVQLAPVVAFTLMMSIPQYTLAFSQHSAVGVPFTLQANRVLLAQPPLSSPMLPAGTVLGVTVTAYSSTVDQTDSSPFITASGTRVRSGVVASNFLPIGTKVQLNGRVYTVEDRSGAGGGHHIDIWMPSRQAAQAFGIHHQAVIVVSGP